MEMAWSGHTLRLTKSSNAAATSSPGRIRNTCVVLFREVPNSCGALRRSACEYVVAVGVVGSGWWWRWGWLLVLLLVLLLLLLLGVRVRVLVVVVVVVLFDAKRSDVVGRCVMCALEDV